MPKRTSIALTGSMAHHPEVQHEVAEMRIALRTPPEALLERTCADWADGVEYEDWPVRLVADAVLRDQPGLRASSTAPSTSAEVPVRSNGTGWSRSSATCAWVVSTPANTLLAHELIGKLSLGIDPDSPQRVGLTSFPTSRQRLGGIRHQAFE